MILLAALLAGIFAAAQTPPACDSVDGIGCVYVPASAASDGSAPLMIYFRGWTKIYDGSVPAAERPRSSRAALVDYKLNVAADAAGAVLLVTGSSDAAVRT